MGYREALRTAIDQAKAAERVAEAARAAVKRTNEIVEAASDQFSQAVADVANAREAEAARMASAGSSGVALAAGKTMREARGREQDAIDRLDAARAALAMVEAALAEAEGALRHAQNFVDEAVRPVMAVGAEQLMTDITRLQAEAADKRARLSFLLTTCFS